MMDISSLDKANELMRRIAHVKSLTAAFVSIEREFEEKAAVASIRCSFSIPNSDAFKHISMESLHRHEVLMERAVKAMRKELEGIKSELEDE